MSLENYIAPHTWICLSKSHVEHVRLTAKSPSSQTNGRRPKRVLVAIGSSLLDLVLKSYS